MQTMSILDRAVLLIVGLAVGSYCRWQMSFWRNGFWPYSSKPPPKLRILFVYLTRFGVIVSGLLAAAAFFAAVFGHRVT